MAAVQQKRMSQRKAASYYSIPRRTLNNHLKSGKSDKKMGRSTTLTDEQENDLAFRIKRLASIGFPLTPRRIRHQAYIFCEENKIPHRFNHTLQRAGKEWLKLFLKRHPDISKRKAQILNPARAQKLNKSIVSAHFEEYKKVYVNLDITNHPEQLYNMDEKGCRLTVHKQPTILTQRGVKRVHIVAPEHGENVTVAACVNALGCAVPPMIIFKGKRLKPELTDNLPAGSLVKMAPKGSMNTPLFVDFIEHFGKHKSPGKCLLVFDGAKCHLDYTIVDAADKNDVLLYCLPSNTTHELQPLDKSVNKSFEHFWDQEALNFLYQNPDKKITKARFNYLLNKIWSKCMTHENIVNGFRATGLYPFNPDAIPPEAFAPSVLTERQQEVSTGDQLTATPNARTFDTSYGADVSRNEGCTRSSPTAGTSTSANAGTSYANICEIADSSDSNVTGTVNSDSENDGNESDDSVSLLTPGELAVVACEKNIRLVDYSSSESDFMGTELITEKLRNVDANIPGRRPITIYSSDTDTSVESINAISKALVLRKKLETSQHFITYSSSSEDENIPLRNERTPDRNMSIVEYLQQKQNV